MDPRVFSKTTQLSEFSKGKPKYGENSPAQIIQKARNELASNNKIPSQHISKPKPFKSSAFCLQLSITKPLGDNLTPVINTRSEKDDPNVNRSQSNYNSTTFADLSFIIIFFSYALWH